MKPEIFELGNACHEAVCKTGDARELKLTFRTYLQAAYDAGRKDLLAEQEAERKAALKAAAAGGGKKGKGKGKQIDEDEGQNVNGGLEAPQDSAPADESSTTDETPSA